jgi:hypothetical protein
MKTASDLRLWNLGLGTWNFKSLLWLFVCATIGLANEKPSDKASLEGQELARELTAIEPSQSLTNTGVLVLRDKQRGEVRVPVRMMIQLGADGWTTTYQTITTDTNYLAALVIHQAPARPNRYEIRAGNAAASSTEAQPAALPVTGLMTPFAGSDFWVADLGLEFLRWPQQRLLRKELRRGQSCNVLESAQTNATAGGYTRVVSWIDIDTGGIVEAEAYDTAGKLMKVFKPISFQKLEGRWEVKKLEIANRQDGTRTRLEFELLDKVDALKAAP